MRADALIVDDCADTCSMLEMAFSVFGLVAHTASSGEDALLYLRLRPPPCVVFLDFVMPEMTGDVLLKRIRQMYPEDALAVYMVSGRPDLKNRVDCPVMLKPVDVRRLVSITRYHCDQRDQRGQFEKSRHRRGRAARRGGLTSEA